MSLNTLLCVGVALIGSASSWAANLPIQVVAHHDQAQARNVNSAYFVVQLLNPDGSPRVMVTLPKLAADVTSGLELKGSNWSFQTITVPAGFEGLGVQLLRPADFFNPTRLTRNVTLLGQLRLMRIAPAFQANNPDDPLRGLYYFTVLPMYGFQGAQKKTLPWLSGEYVFRISYREGQDQGSAIAVLTIP